jgi:orotate phosphoribosyltransferase
MAMRLKELLRLNPADFREKGISEPDVISWFELCDAYWGYEGEPSSKNSHAELTSGKCSDAFFDCLRVLRHPNLCEILARQLASRLAPYSLTGDGFAKPDWVIGSAYAAITFSFEVAKIFGAVHGFVEKDPKDPEGKKMVWKRMQIPEGAKVLQVEELITTIGTTKEVRRAVQEGNGIPVNFLPIVGALVHRPAELPITYGDDMKVVAVIERAVHSWNPAECPLCKAGSPRFRPKTHWAELTGKK